MERATDPIQGDDINVAEYTKRYGRRTAGVIRPEPLCPVCRQAMHAVGDGSPNTVGHFAHGQNSGFCPTKESAQVPYLALPSSSPDRENADRLRADFAQHWERYVGFMRSRDLALYLGLDELDEMLTVAHQKRVWEYKHLQSWQVPLCLLVTREFPPYTSSWGANGQPARKLWFRFWFDPTVSGLGDLWIRQPARVMLHRASYRAPVRRRGVPGVDDLQRVSSTEVSQAAVASGQMECTERMRAAFAKIVAKHLG